MRIRSITPMTVQLPLTKPLKLSDMTLVTADNLLVRIVDSDGNVGWGEAASAPTMTGETPEGMLAAAKFMVPRLVGKEVEDVTTFSTQLDGLMYGNAGAKSAIDMALYDLAGKRAGVPVSDLLGGAQRRQLPVLWMLAANDRAADTAAAQRMTDAGFVAFKVKVGSANVPSDLARAAAAREAAGKTARISADANQAFSIADAVRFAQGAEAAGLDFIEQPVMGHDLEGMAEVARATPVPIGTDEGVHSLADLERHHAMKAARGASLKTIKLGGLSQVMAAGRLMHALGMHVNLASKIADSGIGSAAIIHIGAALPQLDWDISITCQYLAQDIVTEPFKVEHGHVRAPDRPGLGITVDESKLSRFSQRLAA
jgi:L-alanine-DL-glutamate epimerase-like enolase superfamily enzyme